MANSLSRLPSGAPNFKGVYRQNKQSDYDLKKAICEFLDNAITICNTIKLKIKISEDHKINFISISDNANGFVNMFETGTSNPFNMTHMRIGQDNDAETSQFGIGLKAGAISTADKMCIYTKVNDKYYMIEFDFLEMCEREEDSFSPNVYEITYVQYKSKHPFDKGSTILLELIRDSIYKKTNQLDLDTYLIDELSKIYNDFIKNGIKIIINDKEIHESDDIYQTNECKYFTKNANIYYYPPENYYYIELGTNYHWYDVKDDKVKMFKKGKDQQLKKMIEDERTYQIGQIKSTITCFKLKEDDIKPMGETGIYRNGRLYGTWKKNGSRFDGNKNYNISRIDIESKELAKKLGLTFNKNISENIINTETSAFNAFIKLMYTGLNANKSTKDYTKLYEIACRHGLNVVGKEPTNNDISDISDSESIDSTSSNIKPTKSKNKKKCVKPSTIEPIKNDVNEPPIIDQQTNKNDVNEAPIIEPQTNKTDENEPIINDVNELPIIEPQTNKINENETLTNKNLPIQQPNVICKSKKIEYNKGPLTYDMIEEMKIIIETNKNQLINSENGIKAYNLIKNIVI